MQTNDASRPRIFWIESLEGWPLSLRETFYSCLQLIRLQCATPHLRNLISSPQHQKKTQKTKASRRRKMSRIKRTRKSEVMLCGRVSKQLLHCHRTNALLVHWQRFSSKFARTRSRTTTGGCFNPASLGRTLWPGRCVPCPLTSATHAWTVLLSPRTGFNMWCTAILRGLHMHSIHAWLKPSVWGSACTWPPRATTL